VIGGWEEVSMPDGNTLTNPATDRRRPTWRTDGRRASSGPAAERRPLRAWLAVTAVTVGTFTVVTVESLPAGLLTSIAGGLRVADAEVGLLVTVSGLVAAASAAVLPIAIRSLDRRTVLVGLTALIVAGTVLSAASPDFPVLLASRVLIGISIGGFWALAAGIAVRLVPAGQVPRATSVIFFGPMAANVLGVPVGTLLGSLAGWRVAFLAVAVLGVLLIAALLLVLPRMPAAQPIRVGTLLEQLRNSAVRVGVLATFLLVCGHYAAFTFVSPVLQKIAGIHPHTVGLLLLAYGSFAILGNFLAGSMAARNVRATIITLSLLFAAVLALIPVIGTTPVTGTLLLIAWGLAFGALPVSVQTWILKAAPNATEAATSLNTCMFNLAIALGALFASVIAGNVAIRGVLWFAAGVVILTSLAVWRTHEI
jgi:predicted MFS family arabinose efflux permease